MKVPDLKPPSAEYILALRSELEEQFADDDKQIDRARDDRELKNDVPMADAWKKFAVQFRDPTQSDEIGRTAAELSINPMTLTCTPSLQTEKGQENATLREKWTQGVFNQAGRRIPGLDTSSNVIDSMVAFGGGWSKFLFARDLWDVRYGLSKTQFTDDPMEIDDDGKVTRNGGSTKEAKYLSAVDEAKKAAGSPYIWLGTDVRTIYPSFQGVRLAEVLEVSKRPRHSTFRQYRLTTDKEGNIVPDELGQSQATIISGPSVDFLELWTDEYCGYVVSSVNDRGQPTAAYAQDKKGQDLVWRHGYQRPPYFYAPGLLQSQWRNRKVGWGVGESMRWLVEYRSWLMTALAQGVGRDLNVSWFRTRPDGAQVTFGNDDSPKVKEVFEPNLIYDGQAGEAISLFPYPPVSESLKMTLDVVNTLIAALKSPQVNSLSGLEGAGFAINQVLSYLKVKYSPLMQSMERKMTELTEFMWWLSRKKVREKIWIFDRGKTTKGYLAIDPKLDLAPTVDIEWNLNPEQPSDKLILNRYLTERLQSGTIGKTEVVERLGDNPDEIRLSIAMDQIRASPEYMKLLQDKVVQMLGRGDLISEAQQAQQIAQTGVIPPAMGSSVMPDQGQAALGPPGQTAGQPQIPTQSGAGTAMQAITP